jgi:AcrR family transcriptional regulator
MARLKSPAKRGAILEAAVREIARNGLAASTASIAKRAGVASGTLFTYFASKEALLNELYLELKREVYGRVNADFPATANLERRARHFWTEVMAWALERPEHRKVSVLLNLSEFLTAETRAKGLALRGRSEAVLSEIGRRPPLRGLPPQFVSSFMGAIQETTIGVVARQPKRRDELIDRSFQVFWRAVR